MSSLLSFKRPKISNPLRRQSLMSLRQNWSAQARNLPVLSVCRSTRSTTKPHLSRATYQRALHDPKTGNMTYAELFAALQGQSISKRDSFWMGNSICRERDPGAMRLQTLVFSSSRTDNSIKSPWRHLHKARQPSPVSYREHYYPEQTVFTSAETSWGLEH